MRFFQKPLIVLSIIILLGLFLRLYKLEIFYPWGHDQDLFAWIAKDIIIDHHFRLIGQETSITGVFIGPLFYYLIALSFVLFNMNPLSAAVVTSIVSLLTIFSIYWVFTKFFNEKVGLIGAFLYAFSPGIILLDRWVVPTQFTNLWVAWYLYLLPSILKGNFPLILFSILVGLIWHIHVAFIPLLIILPFAFWLSFKKGHRFKFKFRDVIISIVAFVILMSPFFVFEARHGFQQIKGLARATYEDKNDVKGIKRLTKVFNISGRSLAGVVMLDKNPTVPAEFFILLPIIFLALIIYLYKNKKLNKDLTIIFSLWIAVNLLAQFISKRSIPEYYFANLFVVFFLTLALLVSSVNIKRYSIAPLLMVIFSLVVIFWFISRSDDQGGFLQKRKAIEYIKENVQEEGYPCIGINFIEGQPGLPNGFRYLFWLNGLNVISASNDIPVYSIVTPWTISEKEINTKFGIFGIILPIKRTIDPKICNEPKRQLLPLWGFTN